MVCHRLYSNSTRFFGGVFLRTSCKWTWHWKVGLYSCFGDLQTSWFHFAMHHHIRPNLILLVVSDKMQKTSRDSDRNNQQLPKKLRFHKKTCLKVDSKEYTKVNIITYNENILPSFTANFVSLCLGCASSATDRKARANSFT